MVAMEEKRQTGKMEKETQRKETIVSEEGIKKQFGNKSDNYGNWMIAKRRMWCDANQNKQVNKYHELTNGKFFPKNEESNPKISQSHLMF